MSTEHPKLSALRQAFHEVEEDHRAAGIRITVERAISFSDSSVTHGLRIERERTTPDGQWGKPSPILFLINTADQTPTDMLRLLADLIDGRDERMSEPNAIDPEGMAAARAVAALGTGFAILGGPDHQRISGP
jgi:hypothetical protein